MGILWTDDQKETIRTAEMYLRQRQDAQQIALMEKVAAARAERLQKKETRNLILLSPIVIVALWWLVRFILTA